MSNRFFDFLSEVAKPFRFQPRTKARAEDVNARLDEVSHGFELVQAELDARSGEIQALQAGKAPLASPAMTGNATLDGKALATQEHVASVAMQTAIPVPAGAARKQALVDASGAVAGWAWPLWELVTASAQAQPGQRLAVLATEAGVVITMPAASEPHTPVSIRAQRHLDAVSFNIQPAPGHAFEGLAVDEPLEMDVPGLTLDFVFNTNVWSPV